MILQPAYGRDYKSKADLLKDFYAGKNFIINDFRHPYDGKPANINDLMLDQLTTVTFRFSKNRRVFTHTIQVKYDNA